MGRAKNILATVAEDKLLLHVINLFSTRIKNSGRVKLEIILSIPVSFTMRKKIWKRINVEGISREIAYIEGLDGNHRQPLNPFNHVLEIVWKTSIVHAEALSKFIYMSHFALGEMMEKKWRSVALLNASGRAFDAIKLYCASDDKRNIRK